MLFMKKSLLINISALFFSVWAINSLGGNIYKWTDANGVVHYEDKVPADQTQSTTKVIIHNNQNFSTRSSSPNLGYEALKQKLNKLEEAQKQSAEEEAINQKSKEQQDARAKGCENARRTLAALQERARARIKDKDGEYKVLTQEEKTEEENKLKDQIKELCSPTL